MATGTDGGRRARAPRRPADERRRELAESAAVLFHRLGFHRVSLADVAAAVGVTAPAVYRHYRNKNALLAGAIGTGLDHVEAALGEAGSLGPALDLLAEAALRRRDVWVLLQREIRHLDERDHADASARFRGLVRRFAAHVADARPDLDDGAVQVLVTAVFAVLASPSTQPVALDHDDYRAALVAAATAVCGTVLPAAPAEPAAARPAGHDPARREQVLRTAIGLFHRHGYTAVSIDDIGAAAGIAGPSIYHHFPTKAHLLLAAHERATALLPSPDPADARPLPGLVERYVAVALRERELFGVHVTEGIHLPADAEAVRVHRADVDAWVAALRADRDDPDDGGGPDGGGPDDGGPDDGGLDAVHAELLVHAARSAVHDVARIGRLHQRPRIAAELVAVTTAVLAAGR